MEILIIDDFSSYDNRFLDLLKRYIKNSYEIIYKRKKYHRLSLKRIADILNIKSKNIIRMKLKKLIKYKIIEIINIGQKIFFRFKNGGTMIIKRRKIIPSNMLKDYNDVVSAYNLSITHNKGYTIYPFPSHKHEKYIGLFKDITRFLTRLLIRKNGSRRTISLRLLAVNYFKEYERLTKNKKYKKFRMRLISSNFIKKNFLNWVLQKDTTYLDKDFIKETRKLIKDMEAKYIDEVNMIKNGDISFVKGLIPEEVNPIIKKEKKEISDKYAR